MAVRAKRGQSFAADRRLAEVAEKHKSLEAAAKALGRKPESVAKSARRLGVFHLKLKAKGK
jgi:hypothetical protein